MAALTAGRGYLLVFVTFLTGCASSSHEVNRFLGDKTLAILEHPVAAQAVRVAPMRGGHTTLPAVAQNLDDFVVVLEPGPRLGKDYATQIAAVFRDASTYRFDAAKGCLFDPGVLFRVWGEGDRGFADFIVCFHCDEFEFRTHDARKKVIHQGNQNCDAAHTKLAKLAQKAFPDNAELKALTP